MLGYADLTPGSPTRPGERRPGRPALVTNSGRSTWFVGVLVLMVDLIFAMTLYLLPPRAL
jgi:hypothetical protein